MIKNFILTALLLCLNCYSFSQTEDLDKIDFKKSMFANLEMIKNIEAQMKYIPQSSFSSIEGTISPGDFYISAYEVTNQMYNAFLMDLNGNGLISLCEKVKIDGLGWKKLSEAYATASKYYDSDPKFHSYPVVNVTKEGAELFCIWLTRLYAQYDGAKYPGAEFRLPKDNEWMVAASGGVKNALYPWEGKFLRNKKGEYAANFKIAGEENIRLNPETGNIEILDDNVLYQSALQPVKAYEPNKFGLYQMAGNAAEITLNGGIKGGSWHSYGHYMQIAAEEEYNISNLPNPFTGFRFVLITK